MGRSCYCRLRELYAIRTPLVKHRYLCNAHNDSVLATEQVPDRSSQSRTTDPDTSWIEGKVVDSLSALPYVRSISYELYPDGDWLVVIRHDNDDIGDAMSNVVEKTIALEKIPGIPYLDSRILHVRDVVHFIPKNPKNIFER